MKLPSDEAARTTLQALQIAADSPKVSAGEGTAFTVAQAVAKAFADYAAGAITLEQLQVRLVTAVLPTTGVAHDVYRFFTGSPPQPDGMSYLIDSPDNQGDLTDPYYAAFSVENRYINFAVNLGKIGEGRAGFEARYGAMTFAEAVATAYEEVIGFDQAQAAGVIVEAALRYIESQQAYFEALGGDAVGAKAAMVGYVISVAGAFQVGTYYEDLQDHVVETIVGSLASSPAHWDLI